MRRVRRASVSATATATTATISPISITSYSTGRGGSTEPRRETNLSCHHRDPSNAYCRVEGGRCARFPGGGPPPTGARASCAHRDSGPQPVHNVLTSRVALVPIRKNGVGQPPRSADSGVVPGQAEFIGLVV